MPRKKKIWEERREGFRQAHLHYLDNLVREQVCRVLELKGEIDTRDVNDASFTALAPHRQIWPEWYATVSD